MTCEEAFRDLKSTRHGLAFRYSMSRNTHRLAVLCFIGAIAARICMTVGKAVDGSAFLFSLYANTVRTRRVLSLFTVGQTILGDVFASLHLGLLPAPP